MDPHASECCAAILGMQELYGVENQPHPDRTRRTAVGRTSTAAERCPAGRADRRDAPCSPGKSTPLVQERQQHVWVV